MAHPDNGGSRPARPLARLLRLATVFVLGFGAASALAAADDEAAEDASREPVAYVDLAPGIVVNFAAEQTKAHFMRAVVSLQVAEDDAEVVKKHEIAIRHHLIMFLSALTEEETSNPEAIDAIRLGALEASQEAIARWNREVQIQDLFFSSLVMH